MSYRTEQEQGNIQALVIDGFEKGIAASPYSGIANIRNLGIRYYSGTAYVNYKRQACTLSGGTMTKPQYACKSDGGIIYILDDSQQVWKQASAGSSTFNLLTGNSSSGGTGNGIAYWQKYLIVFRGTAIDICGDGTGDGGITSSNWNTGASASGVWPIAAATITLTGTPSSGDTSATISTYTDAHGDARAFWNGPTGQYQLTFGNSQTVTGTLTQGSAAVTWSPALYSSGASSTMTVAALFAGSHQAFVSPSDGNLYFCNGQYVGVLRLNLTTGYYTFVKGVMSTFNFNFGVVRIQNETIGWIDQLFSNLVIAGVNAIYLWDRTSVAVQAPAQVPDTISKIINVNNTIYIFAGNKGNIYYTNGYSVSLFQKVPDGLFNLIDPYLQWGGVMGKRNNVVFQVFASTATGTGQAEAIMSCDADGVLTVENQNSFGYTITGTAAPNGVLVDYPSATMNAYFSAWYNNGGGGVDFNDSTLYQNFEPVIETDLIPVGTYLQSRTFENIEYKLDRPLVSGDQIRLSYRTDLAGSYTAIGTTTATSGFLPLSDSFSSNIQQAQWVQFKIEFACASSGSSRIPLREIRIH